MLTNTPKDHRMPFLNKYNWDIITRSIDKPEMKMVELVKD